MVPFVQIKETCLYVADLDRTRHFYTHVLGLPVISHVPGQHVFFRTGTSVLLCFLPEASARKVNPPPHYGHGQLHLALEVATEDYGPAKEMLLQAGVALEQEQTWQRGLRSVYFRDPDGHCLEIIQAGAWDVPTD